MRDGFYRLHYKSGPVLGSGVITVHSGILAGCDPHYFIHGTYKRRGNRLEGELAFERHTDRLAQNPLAPELFSVHLSGVCGDNYGVFDFHCLEVPAIKGTSRFTWLGEYQS